MKNNFYTIFFASERNKYSRSFQLSKVSFTVLVFFGIMVLGFSFFGVATLLNKDSIVSKLKVVKKENVSLQNLFSDIELLAAVDTSSKYEEFILSYYGEDNFYLPNKLPVSGYVTRGLNKSQNHFGVDIAAKLKDKIFSPGYGRVIFSGKNDDLGNTIIISHVGGFVTMFAHNDSNLVHSGMLVEKGQLIGYIGETGNSKGPHLHFEMWKNSEILDPREIILEYKKKDVSIK